MDKTQITLHVGRNQIGERAFQAAAPACGTASRVTSGRHAQSQTSKNSQNLTFMYMLINSVLCL